MYKVHGDNIRKTLIPLHTHIRPMCLALILFGKGKKDPKSTPTTNVKKCLNLHSISFDYPGYGITNRRLLQFLIDLEAEFAELADGVILTFDDPRLRGQAQNGATEE